MSELQRCSIGQDIWFSSIIDSKFEYNSVSVNLVDLPTPDTVSANALLTTVLTHSCKKYPTAIALERKLCDLYGSDLDGSVAKFADNQVLTFCGVGLDDRLTAHQEEVTKGISDLLFDIILDPLVIDGAFEKTAFEDEKRDLAESIAASINDKRLYALNRNMEMMYPGSRMALPRYGNLDTLEKITSKSLYCRYLELLKEAKIEITFVGCGNPTEIKTMAEQRFSKIKRQPETIEKLSVHEKPEQEKEFREELDITQSKLVLSWYYPQTLDRHENDVFQLMGQIFGATPFSRLFTNVREKQSLCYYCTCNTDPLTGRVQVDSGVEHQNAIKTKEAILQEWKALAQDGPTLDELEKTKLLVKNSIRAIGDSIGSLENWYLSGLLKGKSRNPQEKIDELEKITCEEIQQAAQKMIFEGSYLLTGKGQNK